MVLGMVKFTQPFAERPYWSEPTALHTPRAIAAASSTPITEKTRRFVRLDSLGPPDSWSAPSPVLLYIGVPLMIAHCRS
jgi:hypothetical protein